MAFCHEKTRTSEPLCVLESGDALLARVAPMQNASRGYAFWICLLQSECRGLRWIVTVCAQGTLSRKVAEEKNWFD